MELLADARVFSSRPSGIGMYAYHYLKELAKREDIKLTLVTDVAVSEEIKALAAAGVPVICYGKAIFRSALVVKYFRFVKDELVRRQPDFFWEPNCLIPIPLTGYKGKIMVTIYDMFPMTMKECFGLKYRMYFRYGIARTIRCADLLLYDSEVARQETFTFFPAAKKNRDRVAYPIVERSHKSITFPERSRKKTPYFFYLGNVEKRKGSDTLLLAYRFYREMGGTKGLTIAGGIKDAELKKEIGEAEKMPHFHYRGYVSEAEKQELFARCDTFLFPSRAEGFGIPVLEAMDAGKPVLAVDLPIYDEVVGNAITTVPLEEDVRVQALSLAEAMLAETVFEKDLYETVLNRYQGERLAEELVKTMKEL